MEGRRVNDSWYMGGVSHGYGGLGGSGMDVMVGKFTEKSLKVSVA